MPDDPAPYKARRIRDGPGAVWVVIGPGGPAQAGGERLIFFDEAVARRYARRRNAQHAQRDLFQNPED